MSAMTDDLVETVTPVGAEHAQLDDARLTTAVRRAVGAAADADVVVISRDLETVAYDIGTVSTGASQRSWNARQLLPACFPDCIYPSQVAILDTHPK